ncbi:thioesterase family protein [Rugosimonospora acidiphila]|uniref:Thioesterase family protein n=1 Tax=Rugosimonospora acidiphila TaxID=556531 RepID=A0ABP9S5L8_9ACTN
MDLRPGLATRVQLTVTDADTAQSLGSGDVPVLGTPRALALAEAATVALTAGRLPAGATTVGVRVELEHLAATPVGGLVVAEAVISEVDGRRLSFVVTLRQGEQVAARIQVERVIVDRETFVAKAYS